jgi:hypothetical protein
MVLPASDASVADRIAAVSVGQPVGFTPIPHGENVLRRDACRPGNANAASPHIPSRSFWLFRHAPAAKREVLS